MASADAVKPGLTVLAEPLHEVDGARFLFGLRSALGWLESKVEQVNELNVFPVPDGDTGSNMFLTMRSAVEEAQKVADPGSAAAVMAAVAHGSLMGARGNSGVILSQIFRGFAQGLGGRATIDAGTLANGLVEAASVAYKAVIKPTEGTVLTVVREASQAARGAARETDDLRVVLDRAVSEAHAAVARTTGQLAVLREAGVVDAGGYGFAVILEGFARALTEPDAAASRVRADARPTEAPGVAAVRRGAAAVEMKEEGWGYCTEFLIHGPGLDAAALRDELAALGESALVVGDADLVRVHIHTPDPAELITAASLRGRLSKLKVEDMSAQHHEVLERADAREAAGAGHAATHAVSAPLAVVAVAPGPGFREIFTGLGCAAVVEGGQTMNPSIEDLLHGVTAANSAATILLPNNGNVILTAQQVDALADEATVVVVPTRNVAQGIAALLALDPTAPAADNAERMTAAMATVTCIEVTRAVRATTTNGIEINEGDVIAVVDDEITQAGDTPLVVLKAAIAARPTAPELITVYRGAGVTVAEADKLVAALKKRFPTPEYEIHDGGQEHYPYVLSLE